MRKYHNEFVKKMGLAVRSGITVAILLGIKAVIDFSGLDIFDLTPTITAQHNI